MTENKSMSLTGNEQGEVNQDTVVGNDAVVKGKTDAGVQSPGLILKDGAMPPVDPVVSDDPESENDKFFKYLLEAASDEEKQELEKGIKGVRNKDNPAGEVAKALRQISFPRDTEDEVIQKMLIDAGHGEDKVREVMEKKPEWVTPESEIVEEVLDHDEQLKSEKMTQEAEMMSKKMSEAMAKVNVPEPKKEDIDHAKAVIDEGRSRYQQWSDENPGLLNKVKRSSRWITGGALVVGIIYLMMLNAITSGAAKRVAK